ncbi:MAG: M48 family metallopeptidase [Sphingomonadaceae bacterium]|nr:M48 family metallopeptidase [Sphingomonadaceae bacterium]
MRQGLGLMVGGAALLLCVPALAQVPFDPDAATRAYMSTLQGAARARSDAYFEGGYWLILWGALVGIGVDLLLLETGVIRRLSAFAARLRRSLAGRTLVFGLVYGLLTALLTLPYTIYEGFWREHDYGLSNQTFAAFMGDWGKQLVIGTILGALVFIPILLLVRRRPNSWWAWSTLVVMAAFTFGIALAPVFIEPLFNKYAPMAEGPLREQILSLARENGVPATNVFVVDASRQTKKIRANVSGLGGTTRIALNDNLLNTRDPAVIKAVMGHEMGHYVLGHVWKSLIQFLLLIGTMLFLISRAVPALLRWRGEHWGVTTIADPAVISVAALVLTLLFAAARPVINRIVYTQEAEADIFGLNAAREPDGFARVAMMLSQYRKIEPGVWEERLFFDHPSGRARVAMAMRWKAEELRRAGQPVVPPK